MIATMTTEPLYKQLLQHEANNFIKKHTDLYNTFHAPPMGTDIISILRMRPGVASTLETVKGYSPQAFSVDLQSLVDDYYKPKSQEAKRTESDFYSWKDSEIKRLTDERNAVIASKAKEANNSVEPLRVKHQELLAYKEQLKDVLIKYNIMPSDIQISDDISGEEFMALMDSSLEVCRKFDKKKMKLGKILYWPADDEVADRRFKLYYLLGLAVGFYILAPVFSVGTIGYLLYSTASMYKKIDKLRIAESLMYNVDFSKYIPEVDIGEIPEVDMSDIEEKEHQMLDSLDNIAQTKEWEEQSRLVSSDLSYIQTVCKDTYYTVEAAYNKKVNEFKSLLDDLDIAIEEYKNRMVDFTSRISTSAVMSYKYTVAVIEDMLYLETTYQPSNFIFPASNRYESINLLKLYLCNMLLNVKEKHLYTYIFDPENLGSEFAEFYSKVTQEYIKIFTDKFDDVFKELRTYAQNNIKIFGERSIDEYNAEAESVGKVTRDYYLFVIVSGADDVKKMKTFTKFMEYSAKYGVFVWLMSDEDYSNIMSVPTEFDNAKPLRYTSVIGGKVMATYENAIETSKDSGIDYLKAFASKYIPEDKWWTYSTLKGVQLNFGLADGDPSKGFPMYLDDKNVHCLMVGGTGAGKSVAINQMLMTLCCKYSPKELELVMVDFKNVEFSTFSRQADTGILKDGTELPTIRSVEMFKSIIPHAKVLAGTKDGEYAVSIFDYLCAEMDRRTKIFSDAGCKNIMEYREKYPDAYMPRIVCIIDEFQVMFTEVDPKMVEIIKSRITSLSKLARFCGCHLWFTSQSMKGTLSQDILEQFTLRVALRCASTVSVDIIGNNAAGKIKSKVGYLYTNDSAGEDPSKNILWRVPYAPTSDIMKTLEKLLALCKQKGIASQDTTFYDQKYLYSSDRLDYNYDKYRDAFSSPYFMILGERTGYSTNKAPNHMKFTRDDGEHMACVAFERQDMLNLAMTIVDNINHKDGGATLLMHSADRDSHTLLDIPSLVPGFEDISDPRYPTEDLLEALEGLVEDRQSRDISECKPLYFIGIQWEKLPGLSRDSSFKIQDRFKAVFQAAPIVNIHFILICKESGELPTSILNLCQHRIAAKCGDKDSSKFLDSMQATKLPQPTDGIFALYRYGSKVTKFKIYQHTFTTELESREVFIE